jgi:Xaa-Pro aminopeptidase
MRLLFRAIALLVAWLPLGTADAQSDVAFPPGVYAARRERLTGETGDAAIVVPGRYLVGAHDLPKQDPNFWYLTGVESPYAVLVIVREGGKPRSILFLPGSYQFAGAQYPFVDERMRRAIWNRPVRRLAPGPEATRATGVDETRPLDSLARMLPAIVGARATVYLPLGATPMYAPSGFPTPLSELQQFSSGIATILPGKKLIDVTPLVQRMRLVKDSHEIAALREAARLSAQGMIELARVIKPGMNDIEAAGFLEYTWKRLGASRSAFAPIVGSGEAAMTFFTVMGERYNAVNRVMRAGELLFVDYGAAEVRTYTSDICRTFPVSGRFTPEQRKYYDIVLEAQEAAIAMIGPGVMMLDAIKAAAQVFRKHGLEQYEDVRTMGEGKVWGLMPSPTHYLARDAGIVRYTPYGAGVRDLGHHIGLEVQDSRDYSRPLEPGMVITIEPKIYVPEKNIAIMIEDMILVTATGHENLSAAAPKRADDIERAMATRR